MVDQAVGECWGDGLPADGCSLSLPHLDQTPVWIEVVELDAERAAAAAGGFGMRSQQQRVEDDVVAADPGDGVDLLEFPRGQGAADVGGAGGVSRLGVPGVASSSTSCPPAACW
jgi:hypothetical protein